MARQDLDLVPIVGTGGALAGVMTERALARRYIRESREPSELDAPTNVSAIVKVLQGEVLTGGDSEVSGQIWCMAMDIGALPSEIGPGDVVVVGNRDDAQRAAIELGVGLLVVSNGTQPEPETVALAQEHGVPVVTSPLDSYVTARMITLSAPVPRADGPEAADRPPGRPALRRRRRGQGGPLPRRGRGGRAPPADRARHAHGPRQPAPAPRAAGRPRRAGAERAGRRAGRDRRDPRPPPHRLDRDDRARAGHVRPRRLDLDARDRALPPERDGAERLLRAAAARRDHVGHGHPQLADDDRARLGRRRVPRPRARDRSDGVRARDVRGRPPTSRAWTRTRSSRATSRSTRSRGGHTIGIAQVETVGQGVDGAQGGADGGDGPRARAQRLSRSTR